MRLSEVDDLPFHQVPTPFNVAGTSDAHFNDGYWFATYSAGVYLAMGLRLHPNSNVMDAFAGIARDGWQEVLRCSRVLRPSHTDLAVGPLRVELVRPMATVRIALREAPADLAFELEFESRDEPFLEAPYRHYRHGHLINDVVRYTQVCRCTGTIEHNGEQLRADAWHALRDHSWGIRSSMGPRTPHGGPGRDPSEADRRRFRLWVPFETDAEIGFFNTHEDEHGEPLDFEGRLRLADGTHVRLAGVRHELEYHPQTKHVAGGGFALRDDDGTWREYRIEPSGTPADVQGFGYYGGWRDGGSAGVWRGDGPLVEHDRYPAGPEHGRSAPEHVEPARRLGPTEYPCFVTGPGGARGMAHLEHHVLGRYRPYGFA